MNQRYIPCDQESYICVGRIKYGKPLFYIKLLKLFYKPTQVLITNSQQSGSKNTFHATTWFAMKILIIDVLGLYLFSVMAQ